MGYNFNAMPRCVGFNAVSVALEGDKEDWVISVDSVSSLSVSFCTGAFSV